MSGASAWARWTGPTTAGKLSQRRETVLFTVLAGMVVLSALTLAIQMGNLLFSSRHQEPLWIGADLLVGAGSAAMLLAARRGLQRPVAFGLVALLGALAVAILRSDGADKPMWGVLVMFSLVLAAMLLGRREAVTALALAGAVLVPLVALEDAGTIAPLSDDAAEDTGVDTAVVALALVGFLVALCLLYTRESLLTVDQQLTRGAALSPLRALRTRELSLREVEVVRLVAEGLSNEAIAGRLFVSPRTVQSHVANAMRKCGCANRTELGVLAVREGLAPLDQPSSA